MEIWKKIDEFPDYEVSNSGKIKSNKWGKERILKDRPDGCGYYQVILLKNGIQHSKKVHKLVAISFIPNESPTEKFLVDHIDRCVTNNRVENLRWVNRSENRLNSHQKMLPMYGITMYKNKKFKVQLNVSRNMTYLGCYETLEEAQRVRDNFLLTIER
jgi:hypothetical protein